MKYAHQEVSLEQINQAQNHLTGPQYGVLDSGATDHFVPTTYHGTNHKYATTGMTVEYANGNAMQSKATDCLALSNLPSTAQTCYKVDEVDLPLVSITKLCAHVCKV